MSTETSIPHDPDLIYLVIQEDHRLEDVAERGTEALAQHRWHWTMDPSNPDRMDFTTYAEYAGRSISRIAAMANGFNLTVENDDLDLTEAIARAMTGAKRTEIVEAVAVATGKTFQNVVKNNAPLVKKVRQHAENRAMDKGTTVSEELPRAAEFVVAAERAAHNEKARQRASKSHQLLVLEGHLANAQLSLRYALRDTELLDDEERTYLGTVIARLRSMLDLLDLRITDSADSIDWDAELAKLGQS